MEACALPKKCLKVPENLFFRKRIKITLDIPSSYAKIWGETKFQ